MNEYERKALQGVPDYRAAELLPKRSEYCLLIPVINEGARILTELGRAQTAGVDTLCDIVICDGGSTDGSMKLDTLQLYGVNTLLTKTGPGKQGAQLRMGIYFALNRGYKGVLDMALAHFRMDEKTLDAMWTAIREALPELREYFKAKGRLLGHENGLPFYDLFAPVGHASRTYTVEEARALLLDLFGRFCPEMGDMMRAAFDEGWIDMYPREGKSGGAFCAGYYEKNISRVMTNFAGSASDVSTLAHELGHAWHNRCLTSVPMLMTETPMPLAETASIFNETLLSQTVRRSADDATRLVLLENSLMEATQTVVDIYSRYLFESAVIEARKTHIPSAQELNGFMLDAQEQSYGDGLSKDARHPSMWVCKSHYYSTGLHFYNFPYAFGLLFGLGVFVQFQKEGAAFVPKYDKLLASCGSDTVRNVAASVGIDVNSVDYWRSALDVVRGEINEFLALSEKKC